MNVAVHIMHILLKWKIFALSAHTFYMVMKNVSISLMMGDVQSVFGMAVLLNI